MTTLVFLIEQVAIGLYILLGVGILLTWRRWQRARREFRATYFELEKDLARGARGDAVTTLILLLEAVLLVAGIQNVVAPTIRSVSDINVVNAQVITDGDFNTPTPAFNEGAQIDASGVNLTPDDLSLRVLATPTLTPTPVGTIVPNAPAAIGCTEEGATLQIPTNGLRVFEPISVIGTAFMDDFAFYKFELAGPVTGGNFAPLEDHTQMVREAGALGQFVPAFYPPGEYQFRLSVFDITNTMGPSCTVNIYISEPIPTPTPLGQ
ncbi:MAG: hypothetical protein CL610_04580 [Anaerolineaceae bacterium]|nr:hypothetical protein [Anaerolineaceae bacterium]